jgi:hypothetical protein
MRISRINTRSIMKEYWWHTVNSKNVGRLETRTSNILIIDRILWFPTHRYSFIIDRMTYIVVSNPPTFLLLIVYYGFQPIDILSLLTEWRTLWFPALQHSYWLETTTYVIRSIIINNVEVFATTPVNISTYLLLTNLPKTWLKPHLSMMLWCQHNGQKK